MARPYGWNNQAPRRNFSGTPPHITCRICNDVFLNSQAFIDHIETHVSIDHKSPISISASVSRQRQQSPSPPALNAPGASVGIGLARSRLNGQTFTNFNTTTTTTTNFNLPPNLPFNQSFFNGPFFRHETNVMINMSNPTLIQNRPSYSPTPLPLPPPLPQSYPLPPPPPMPNNRPSGSQLIPPNPNQARMRRAVGPENGIPLPLPPRTMPLINKLDKPIVRNLNDDNVNHFDLDLNLKL